MTIKIVDYLVNLWRQFHHFYQKVINTDNCQSCWKLINLLNGYSIGYIRHILKLLFRNNILHIKFHIFRRFLGSNFSRMRFPDSPRRCRVERSGGHRKRRPRLSYKKQDEEKDEEDEEREEEQEEYRRVGRESGVVKIPCLLRS